ncbi:MAG: hypothetical protein MJ200_04850 [Mycoplasmoidaceae bacterium]|nr:hypothetical protein [Mycoplasmoidaceae bacterium]
MKKLHILIPSLVATFSMPLIGLVGCNKEESEHEPIPDQTIILDNYNYSGEYVCATEGLPSQFEKNKTYCFRINLSVIDTSYDDFFDGYG